MTMVEINFDGIVGPLHNYAGLSIGNVASANNAGARSMPRAAALQGLAKMRLLIDRGLHQGILPPLRRPATTALRALGFGGGDRELLSGVADADPILFHNACSASAMWAANAATVIAAPDTYDGRVHLVTANLSTMLHRSLEAPETYQNLMKIFGDGRHFRVHAPLPASRHFSDEGAANHMRITTRHAHAGLNIFVHGDDREGHFPERQSRRAGEAVARMAGVDEDGALHIAQSAEAIQAGAFHNDVVAVANESVLLTHPRAFENQDAVFAEIGARIPRWHPIPLDNVTLDEAVRSYVFNSQLITLPTGGMMLLLPAEAKAVPAVLAAVDTVVAGDNPIAETVFVDVRESMRNGGGPACLRLRVPVSEAARAAINPAYLLDARRVDLLAEVIERWWPEAISPADLQDPALWDAAAAAHDALDQWLATGI